MTKKPRTNTKLQTSNKSGQGHDPEKSVAAVDRAIAILSAFDNGTASLTLTDLMRTTGLHGSTILRLLATLERRNFIVRKDDGAYRLGSKLYALGKVYKESFRFEEQALPTLQRLAAATAESATFFVAEQDMLVVLLRVNSTQPIREHLTVGHRSPMTSSAAEAVIRMFQSGAAGASQESLARLPIVAVGGVLPDRGAIAMPIFGPDSALIGAITISGPQARFTRAAIDEFCVVLIKEVQILAALNGSNPHLFDAALAKRIAILKGAKPNTAAKRRTKRVSLVA